MDRGSRGDVHFLSHRRQTGGRGAFAAGGSLPQVGILQTDIDPPASSLRSSASPRPSAEGTGQEQKQRGPSTYPCVF